MNTCRSSASSRDLERSPERFTTATHRQKTMTNTKYTNRVCKGAAAARAALPGHTGAINCWGINFPYRDVVEIIVQELCESRGGRPGLSVLTSLLVFVDVKNYGTVLRHWSQLVPNMSTDI